MNWVNYDDVISQIEASGLILDKPITFDAHIQRWKVTGEDRERRGWTRLKEWTSKTGNTYIVGAYGIWHGTDDGYTKIELSRVRDQLTDEDMRAIREANKASAKKLADERKAEAKAAANWAAAVWAHCDPCLEHEYLTRKGIQPHGLRTLTVLEGLALPGVDESNYYRLTQAVGALVVPMHDQHGNVCGIQFIYPRGHARAKKIERDKEFWPAGMAMGGTFGLIGALQRTGILLVTEGYATAASLHQATGQSVAYAFSANNLVKTGKLLRKHCSRLRLLFCADDDYMTDGNPGVTWASAATAEIERSAWTKPDFNDDAGNDRRAGKKLTDYNDLAILTGLTLPLADQINAKLDELKWREPETDSGGTTNKGGGESLKSLVTVEDACERLTLIYGGKATVFDHQEHMLVPKGDVLDILPEHGWRTWKERGDARKIARLDQVGFDPTGTDTTLRCNLWGGWPTTPKQGCCDNLLDLLYYLCAHEDNAQEIYGWVLKWLAYPIQHPVAKMRTALVFHGPQRVGKNLFFEAVMAIYGKYGRIVNQDAIEDKFNDWASGKLFLIADEVVARAELYHTKNKLKAFITGDSVRINPKNVASHEERNHINIVFLSNETQPLVLERDDGRYTVIWTPGKLPRQVYVDVGDEIAAGGIEALHHHLLNLDLGDFRPWTEPPMTRAKSELIDLSMDSTERFWFVWKEGHIDDVPFAPCKTEQLYDLYRAWCARHGIKHCAALHQLMATIGKRTDAKKERMRYVNGSGVRQAAIIWPAGILLPPDKAQAAWLGECIGSFGDAIRIWKEDNRQKNNDYQ